MQSQIEKSKNRKIVVRGSWFVFRGSLNQSITSIAKYNRKSKNRKIEK